MNVIQKILTILFSNKRRVLVVFLVFLLASLVIYFKNSQTNKTRIPTTAQKPLKKLEIPKKVDTPSNLTIELKKEDFSFPEKIVVAKKITEGALTDEVVTSISTNLGFETKPNIGTDVVNGKMYFWNSEKNFLIITPRTRHLEFGTSLDTKTLAEAAINKQLTENDYVSLARSFFSKNTGVNINYLQRHEVMYLKTSDKTEFHEITNKNDFEIVQINFSLSENLEYPVYSLSTRFSPAYVQILKDGTVVNAETLIGVYFTKSENVVDLKNYKETTESLESLTLANLMDSNIELGDLKKDVVKTATIKQISLGYLYDDLVDPLNVYPIFILTGEVSLSSYPNQTKATFYTQAYR